MLRVLVCDDDRACRITLLDALQCEGFATYEAQDGHEAMDLARMIPLDFGFFDYKLPDLDGRTTVKLIRKESIMFPFVIMSGEKNIAEVIKGEGDAVAFLPKPLEISQIRRILRTYLVL